MSGRNAAITFLTAIVMLTACEPKPKPIQYGSEECAHCRMLITEPEFASQILNKQGRAWSFDSIECMVAHGLDRGEDLDVHSRWVPDFAGVGNWIPAENAHYLHSPALRSPMGLNLSAYENRTSAEEFRAGYEGELLDWNEVRNLVQIEWLSSHNDHAQHNRH